MPISTDFLTKDNDPLLRWKMGMAIGLIPDAFAQGDAAQENLNELIEYIRKDPDRGAIAWVRACYQVLLKDPARTYPEATDWWVWFAQQLIPHLDAMLGRVPDTAIELADWVETAKSFTSLYLLGEPGAGKTSTMLKFLGLFTHLIGPAQVIAVDLHYAPGKWPDGVTVIKDIEETRQFMEWMISDSGELAARKKAMIAGNGDALTPFIWVIDEVGAIRKAFASLARKKRQEAERLKAKANAYSKEDKAGALEEVADIFAELADIKALLADFLDAMATEGRKYNLFGMAGNQVSNNQASGLDGLGDILEAFTKVYVGKRLCRKWGKLMGLETNERNWLAQQAYPTIVDGQPAYHLTHYGYETCERGQPPLEPIAIQALPVEPKWARRTHLIAPPPAPIATLPPAPVKNPLPSPVTIEVKADQDYEDFLAIRALEQRLGRSPTKKEIILEVFGEENERYASEGRKFTEYGKRIARIKERAEEWSCTTLSAS